MLLWPALSSVLLYFYLDPESELKVERMPMTKYTKEVVRSIWAPYDWSVKIWKSFDEEPCAYIDTH